MEQEIGVIFYAECVEEARNQALEVLENLCDGSVFYSYSLHDISLASSSSAQATIAKYMENTKLAFLDHIRRVREYLAQHTDEELYLEYEDGFVAGTMFRYHALRLGQERGAGIYLYDGDGAGIGTPNVLKNTLDKYKCLYEDRGMPNPIAHLEVFLVCAQVHR